MPARKHGHVLTHCWAAPCSGLNFSLEISLSLNNFTDKSGVHNYISRLPFSNLIFLKQGVPPPSLPPMENGFSESSWFIPFNGTSKSHGLGRDGGIKRYLDGKKNRKVFFSGYLGTNWSTVSVTVSFTAIKSSLKCQRCILGDV